MILTDVQLTKDFREVIAEILATGDYTHAELARTLNVPWTTLNSWRSLPRPPRLSWNHGEALLIVLNSIKQSRSVVTRAC